MELKWKQAFFARPVRIYSRVPVLCLDLSIVLVFLVHSKDYASVDHRKKCTQKFGQSVNGIYMY